MAKGKKPGKNTPGAARRQRIEEMRRAQQRRQRRATGLTIGGSVLVTGVLVALAVIFAGAKATPALAQTGAWVGPAALTGNSVHGIQCNGTEMLAYHIHAHLAIFVDGQQKTIPYGIGMASPGTPQVTTEATPAGKTVYTGPYVSTGNCFYWMHTHAQDGIIHIESPTRKTYTLGDFFDLWNQPLSGSQVAKAHGKVSVYVDGRLWTKNPRSIQLLPHQVIQIDVGSPVVPPQPYTFPTGT